ncbi:hypothetical protein GCK32_018977 [Trichostrongylus colubriformis]|uniref:CCHC-type domain-containing protein n=1 Tax=Trichostrongylus colubriformis TaxID=6319 RepID=A0AAN8FH39_TRICO
MDSKRGSIKTPREGQLIPICEAILPHHSWKMGVIEKLAMNNKGIIREAIVRLPNRRLIRRPVNLSIPLELEEDAVEGTPSFNSTRLDCSAMQGPSQISDIEYEITQAEKRARDEKVQNKEQFITVFNETIGKLEQKFEDFAARFSTSSKEMEPEERSNRDKNNQDGPLPSEDHALSDDDYMQKLIQESRGADTPPEAAERRRRSYSEESDYDRAHEEYIRSLERQLDDLYEGRFLLPQRRIGMEGADVGPWITCVFCGRNGMHFSDSCPEITDGDERFSFVQRNGLCQHCLRDDCAPNRCSGSRKQCWYCNIVAETVLDFLICDDGGHHRALCNVPNSKDRITERIKRVKEELSHAKGQYVQ